MLIQAALPPQLLPYGAPANERQQLPSALLEAIPAIADVEPIGVPVPVAVVYLDLRVPIRVHKIHLDGGAAKWHNLRIP